MDENMQPGPQMPAMQVPPASSQPKSWYSNRAVQAIVILVLLIAGGYLLLQNKNKPGPQTENNTEIKEVPGTLALVPEMERPSLFPSSFPMGGEKQVLQNYTFENASAVSAIRKIVTNQTPEEIYAKFQANHPKETSRWGFSDLKKTSENYYSFNGREGLSTFEATFNKTNNNDWAVEYSITTQKVQIIEPTGDPK
jgi:hypothetical protein